MKQKFNTSKKVTSFVTEGDKADQHTTQPKLNRQKATKLRIFALLSWIVAIFLWSLLLCSCKKTQLIPLGLSFLLQPTYYLLLWDRF